MAETTIAETTKAERNRRRDSFLSLLGVRPVIMGILNVTPDSFSDGDAFNRPSRRWLRRASWSTDGADVIDVGAESTRPGHTPVPLDEEWRRLEPLIGPLLAAIAAPVSIDTYKARNRTSRDCGGGPDRQRRVGLQKDSEMAGVVADGGAAVVIMHNRDACRSRDRHRGRHAKIFRAIDRSADRAGIPRQRMLIDPGIGFGKNKAQNLKALQATARLREAFGLPVLIGVSRKRLFGDLLGAGVEGRLIGTLAANLATLARGAAVFRVHDAAEHAAAFKVFHAIDAA